MTDPGRHEPEALRPPSGELDGQLELWPSPAGYLRHLVGLFAGSTATSLPVPDDDEAPADAPADDGPWRVIQSVRLVPGHEPDEPDEPDTPS